MMVILSPDLRLRCSASLEPPATPWPESKPSSEPWMICPVTPGRRSRSLPRMPRTSAPDEPRRARKRLAFDQRQRQSDARNLTHPRSHRVVVGERRLDPLQEHVAIEAVHLVHEIVAKAIHHRHDDNQRRHAEDDAEERE